MRRGVLARRVVFVTAALALVGCAPPDRAQDADVDALAPPDVSGCGDGVVDPHAFESCDEGALNGTPQSHCSRQCVTGMTAWDGNWGHRLALSAAPVMSDQFQFENAQESFAFVAEPRDALHIIRDFSYEVVYQGEPYEERIIPATGTITALASTYVAGAGYCPFWIERDADGVQHLFFAQWPLGAEPLVHEIAYPFPEGIHASLTSSSLFQILTVVDVSDAHEVLVGALRFDAFPDIELEQRRFTAPVGQPDFVAATFTFGDPRVITGSYLSQTIVQFFTNPTSFVSIHIDGTAASHTIEELGRGAWPYRVVAAQHWLGQPIAECVPIPIERLWPFPLVTLSDGGDLVIWQFDRPWEDGEIDPIFAHVDPLPRAIQAADRGLLAYMPDGDAFYYAGSDCTNLQAPALAPQRIDLDVGEISNATVSTSGYLGYPMTNMTINSQYMRGN